MRPSRITEVQSEICTYFEIFAETRFVYYWRVSFENLRNYYRLTLGTCVCWKLGYGVYVNTTDGGVLLDSCTIMQNGGDGVKLVHHEETTISMVNRNANTMDFCTIPIVSSQTFPIMSNFEQSIFSTQAKECRQVGVR